MKKSTEIATTFGANAAGEKRRSTALKRLAGGIRTEIRQAEYSGLSDEEKKTLIDAATMLDQLALIHKNASSIIAQREKLREGRENVIRKGMEDTFYKLTSVADKIAVVAAIQSFTLRNIHNLDDLAYYLQDSLTSLAYRLSKEKEDPTAAVADAWQKFSENRQSIIAKHADALARLS